MAKMTFDNKLIVFNELEKTKRKDVPQFQCYYQGLSGGLKGNITNYSHASNKIN
uniref:Uncharacterized protein n=1 Tax=Panagrolaimus sp. PS1159 TaxID=55785 RepID=A0AC35EWR7_9BILA